MVEYVCDRCGRLMEGADRANVSYFYGGNGTADLCKGCNEEFLRWMKTERVMEFFNPELYNSAPEVLEFHFHDGTGYKKFAEYAHEQRAHIFVCDNQKLTVTTDAFTKEEAFRIAEVTLGLSTISVVSFKDNENKILWWRMEN